MESFPKKILFCTLMIKLLLGFQTNKLLGCTDSIDDEIGLPNVWEQRLSMCISIFFFFKAVYTFEQQSLV